MLPSPCYVISDLHLGAAPRAIERAAVDFLRHLPGRAGSLVVNGDLFEFWFEWKTVIPRTGIRVIAALADLHDAGIPIVLVAGNHDCWGATALQEEAGVTYQMGPWTGGLGGWRAHVEHGDGLRPEDRGYRMLRPVLRHRLSRTIFRWLHPDLGNRIARGTSHTSRTHQARDGGAGLRAVAMRELEAHPELELLIYAHSHVAALERAPGGGIFANAGSWLDAPTFLRVTPQQVELRRWDGSAEGVRLHALDRLAEEPLPHL